METRIDHITGGIYRIATMTEAYGITFNQFLIDDERPALIHTGMHASYENVRKAISEVLDPAWTFAMHGGTVTREALPAYMKALREQDFGYEDKLLGREVGAPAAAY